MGGMRYIYTYSYCLVAPTLPLFKVSYNYVVGVAWFMAYIELTKCTIYYILYTIYYIL